MSGDDGGSWEQAIVAGRGVCRVWVPDDEHDTRAAMGGLISRHKVAAILGRSRGLVETMIARGSLQSREIGGRVYVTRQSLDRIIAEIGVLSEPEQEIEAALARHDASAAARLEERYFPERAAARGEYSRQMRPVERSEMSQSKGDEPAVKRGGVASALERLLGKAVV